MPTHWEKEQNGVYVASVKQTVFKGRYLFIHCSVANSRVHLGNLKSVCELLLAFDWFDRIQSAKLMHKLKLLILGLRICQWLWELKEWLGSFTVILRTLFSRNTLLHTEHI